MNKYFKIISSNEIYFYRKSQILCDVKNLKNLLMSLKINNFKYYLSKL